MNGVVFQTSAMMITAKELKRSPNQALSSAIERQAVDEAGVGLEREQPGERGDDGDDPVWDQDRGAHDPAAEDRPVHDERDHHAEHELDRDRDHRDEQRVEDVLPPQRRVSTAS